MIKVFLTVGVQLPFDRLVSALLKNSDKFDFRGQVGTTALELPFGVFDFISNEEYVENFKWADVIVSHAGMGSIITSLEYNKPLIIVPRLARFGEHRNDHQLDTVANIYKVIGDASTIYVVEDEEKVFIKAHEILMRPKDGGEIGQNCNLNKLVDYINEALH